MEGRSDSSGDWDFIERPEPRPQADNSRRTVLFVVLAFVILLGAYVLGRSGSRQVAAPEIPERAEPTPTPAPTVESVVDAGGDTETPEGFTAIELLLGPGEIVGELELEDGEQALVFCRGNDGNTRFPVILALVHTGTTADGAMRLIGYQQLATPHLMASTCEGCGPEQVELNGDVVLFGGCIERAEGGKSTVYAIAQPRHGTASPLALHISCGVTSLAATDGELVLDKAGPATTISFERQDGRFWADDLELLRWSCDLLETAQLANLSAREKAGPVELSYQSLESDIGTIGVHGQLVIAFTPDQCALLREASRPPVDDGGGDEDGDEGEAEPRQPLAEILGLQPPAGRADWVYTCDILRL